MFEDINLTLFARQKIGLIGANGSGKSSLFGLVLNDLDPSGGEISINASVRIAHVAQETPATISQAKK